MSDAFERGREAERREHVLAMLGVTGREQPTPAAIDAFRRAHDAVWQQRAPMTQGEAVSVAAEAIRAGLVTAVSMIRFVDAAPCPHIAHESGVVLRCTLDHGNPRSGWHANVHHRALWDEDDDRIIAETASD